MKPIGLTCRRSVIVFCLIAIVIGTPIVVVAGTRSASASPSRPAPWGKPQPLSESQPHTAPAHLTGGSQGHITRAITALPSTNWSGLGESGAQFNGISAQWVVPQVQPSNVNEYSATWIGIDGTSGTSLIQTGTNQNSSSNGTNYSAWYEILPAPEFILGGVLPGDHMQAAVVETSPGVWTITIDDVTSNQGFSQAFSYNGPAASAEWIEEALTVGPPLHIATLADFGSVQFNNVRFGVTGTNTASTNYWEMTDSGGNIIAYPAVFNATSDSQQIFYGSPPNPPPPTTTTTTTTVPPTTTTTSAPPSTTTTTTPPPATCTAPAPQHAGQVTAMAATRAPNGCPGYWIVNAGGSVFTFGNAPYLGGLNGSVATPVIDIIATPDGAGYWLVTANGTVRAFGDAASFGDMSGHQLNGQIIAMATTPDGLGYWLVGSDGGIFSFGDAQFYGSTGAIHLNRTVVGIAAAPDGGGYWLVAADGGIFSFGDTQFLGSMGATPLNKPVVGMTADPAGRGYRMVAADGGIFSFGAPFFGSLGANPPAAPIVNMAPSTDGNGYYMLDAGGGVYSFGDATFLGAAS
jgi:hypothetical protein